MALIFRSLTLNVGRNKRSAVPAIALYYVGLPELRCACSGLRWIAGIALRLFRPTLAQSAKKRLDAFKKP
ncbi:hypothetical protein LF1_04420 [Rubripirellula obstinata]|uniref:Uncharacterized protein n=1 Tax=Rubripirellula obstinata TaxID=406547 RepID=A0A5B1CCJ2_9BACT|nr:hypothetical protein LF1_04420 [Rubripirellula obstinata]